MPGMPGDGEESTRNGLARLVHSAAHRNGSQPPLTSPPALPVILLAPGGPSQDQSVTGPPEPAASHGVLSAAAAPAAAPEAAAGALPQPRARARRGRHRAAAGAGDRRPTGRWGGQGDYRLAVWRDYSLCESLALGTAAAAAMVAVAATVAAALAPHHLTTSSPPQRPSQTHCGCPPPSSPPNAGWHTGR